MAKQNINVGTAANDKKGDSLRAAFQKVNSNFTELYTALGIAADADLNLGNFVFESNTVRLTNANNDDSTATQIEIAQPVRIESDLTVGGDIVPQTANGGDLGSSTLPWRSLYVSNNTIYIGGTAVGLDANGNLTVNGGQVNAPSSTLVNGANTVSLDANGNLTFPQGTLLGYSDPGGFIINGAVDKDIAIYTYNGADAHGWTFGTDGSLTLPGDIKSQGNINIEINLSDSTKRIWQFGEDGDTVFPNNVSINYSGGNIQFPRIIADSGKAFSVQGQGNTGSTALSWTVDPDAASQYAAVSVSRAGGDNLAKVVLQAQSDSGDAATARTWVFNENGALTLPGGSTIAEVGPGGVLQITPRGGANIYQALWIYPTGFAEGDHLHLTAGGGSTELYLGDDDHFVKLANDGFVIIKADDGVNSAVWGFSPDGTTSIPGDIKSDSNINIDINLSDSTLRRWQFGEDGELTLPEDAVVKTISGHLTIKGQEYVFIDSATNGQIEIGRSSGVGAVSLGSKSRGTNVVVDDLQVANGVYEFFSSLADATGVMTHNCANGHIFYHTSPDANWTVNLTNLLDTWNRATSVTIIIAQGATGYYPSAVQIAGVAQTINWQGNATPTPSTNRTDVVTFSIINNAGTYIVLGQLTGF